MHVRTLILGGGPAGVSAAYHLKGAEHLIVESKDSLGGLAGSVNKNGFCFDYTGHLLHLHDPYTLKLIPELLAGNITKHDRRAWIYSNGIFTKYPFQVNTFGLPPKVVDECVRGFRQAVNARKQGDLKGSFSDWVMNTFGPGFAKHFFTPYNEKLWTVSLEDMTTEWMGQFVPVPKASEVDAGALGHVNKAFGYNASFYYPIRGGVNALVTVLALKGNVNALFNTRVMRVHMGSKCVDVDGGHPNTPRRIFFDNLINTLPLRTFGHMIIDAPKMVNAAASRLRATSVYNLNLGVQRENCGDGKHWVYFPEKQFPFYRVGFPHTFSTESVPKGCSSVYVECAHNPINGAMVMPRLKRDCIKALNDCGILRSDDKILAEVELVIPTAYVIYDKARTPNVNVIMDYLAKNKVHSLGRYGP